MINTDIQRDRQGDGSEPSPLFILWVCAIFDIMHIDFTQMLTKLKKI